MYVCVFVRTHLSVEEAEGVREGPESDTTETPESVRSAGGRRELLRRLPGSLLPPELPPSLLVPVTDTQQTVTPSNVQVR